MVGVGGYLQTARYLDELGRETLSAHDGRGRVTSTTYPEGDCELLGYDAHNNTTLLKKVAKADSCNPAASGNIVVTATYDQTFNKPTAIVDARGYTTDFAYYASGSGKYLLQTATRPAATTGGTRPVYTFTYNSKGQVLTATDPTSIVTANTYDSSTGDLLSTVLDSGSGHLNLTTAHTYDAQGDPITTTDPRSKVTTTTWDADRRKTGDLRHDGNGAANLIAATHITYDEVGRVIEEKAGKTFSGASTVSTWFTPKTTTYTPTGKVHTVTDPDGGVTTMAYDALDRLDVITDPVGRRVHTTYDAASQPLIEYRGWESAFQSAYATWTYTSNGQKATVTDANGNKSAYTYDGFDRLVQLTFPSPTTAGSINSSDYEAYAYDAAGNLTSKRTRKGDYILAAYDHLNRLTAKEDRIASSSGTLQKSYAFAYDLAGRLNDLSDSAGNDIATSFDGAGRPVSAATTIPGLTGAKTIGSTLDASGNRTRLTWPDGYYVDYAYDSLNRMTTATDSGSVTLATYTYDPLSRRTALAYGGGASVAYTWSDAGDLLTLAHDFTGSTNDVTFTDTYTAAHQLASEGTSNSLFVFPVPSSTSLSYTRNGLNQYTAVGGTSFSHDGNGSLATDGTYTFVHDVENRLITASKSGMAALYGYDPLGRRVTRSVTTGSFNAWGSFNWSASASCPGVGCWNAGAAPSFTVSDGDNEIAEYDSAGSLVSRTVPGPAIDDPIATVTSGGTRTYFHADRHGSVVAMSGTSSAVTEGPYTYDAYGTVCGASGGSCSTAQTTGTPWRYTGRKLDPETGLYYYRARYYCASDNCGGRFIQTDPVGYTPDVNLYAYVRNDPFNRSDPSGLADACFSCRPPAEIANEINSALNPSPAAASGQPSLATALGVASDVRQGQIAATGTLAVAGANARNAAQVAGQMKGFTKIGGAAAVVLNVASEAARAHDEIASGQPADKAIAGATGRITTSTGASLAGAAIGAGVGTLVGGPFPGGVIGGLVGGAAGGIGSDTTGLTEKGGQVTQGLLPVAKGMAQKFYDKHKVIPDL